MEKELWMEEMGWKFLQEDVNAVLFEVQKSLCNPFQLSPYGQLDWYILDNVQRSFYMYVAFIPWSIFMSKCLSAYYVPEEHNQGQCQLVSSVSFSPCSPPFLSLK